MNLLLSCHYCFCHKNVVCFIHLLHVFKCTPEIFYKEANTMNPDQTAPFGEESDLGPYCLQ